MPDIFLLFWCFPTFLFHFSLLLRLPLSQNKGLAFFLPVFSFLCLPPPEHHCSWGCSISSLIPSQRPAAQLISKPSGALQCPPGPFCCVPMLLAPMLREKGLEDCLVFCVSSLGFYSGHGKPGKLWVIQASAVIALSSHLTDLGDSASLLLFRIEPRASHMETCWNRFISLHYHLKRYLETLAFKCHLPCPLLIFPSLVSSATLCIVFPGLPQLLMSCFLRPYVHLPCSREVLLFFREPDPPASHDTSPVLHPAFTIVEAGVHIIALIGVSRGRQMTPSFPYTFSPLFTEWQTALCPASCSLSLDETLL